jgi:hypothetical protein
VKIEISTLINWSVTVIKEGGGNREVIESIKCPSTGRWSLLEFLKLEDGRLAKKMFKFHCQGWRNGVTGSPEVSASIA